MLRRAQQRAQSILQTRSFILFGGIALWFWLFGVPFLGLDLIKMDVSNEYRRALQASHEDASSEHIETAMHKRLARLTDEMHKATGKAIGEEDDTDSEPVEAAAAAAAIATGVASKQKLQGDVPSPLSPRLTGLRGLQSPLAGQRVLQGVPSTSDSSPDADEEPSTKPVELEEPSGGGPLLKATRLREATEGRGEPSQKDAGEGEAEPEGEAASNVETDVGKETQGNADEESGAGEDGGAGTAQALKGGEEKEDEEGAEQEPEEGGELSKAEASLETGSTSEVPGEENLLRKSSSSSSLGKAGTGTKGGPAEAEGEEADDSPKGGVHPSRAVHGLAHKSHYEERDGKASGHPMVENSDDEHRDKETQEEDEAEAHDDAEASELRRSAKAEDAADGTGTVAEESGVDGEAQHRETSQKADGESLMVPAHAEPGEGAEGIGKGKTSSSEISEPFISDSSADELAFQKTMFSKWAQSTHYSKRRSLPFFPLGHHSTSDSLPRVMIVTARSPDPCTRDGGDFVLYRALKNKMDYARLHGMEIFDADAVVRPDLDQWWQKVALMPMLMLRHPDIEWFFWVDSDAVFTDLSFEVPWERYASYHLVAYGYKHLVYREKDWNGLNGGVWLLRNSPESLSVLKEWAEFGTKGTTRDSWGKKFTQELKDRPTRFPADDQSALVWMMSQQPKKYRHLVYLEHEYQLHGNWENITNNLDDLWQAGRASTDAATSEASSWPFVTHFIGCKPCGGGILAESRRKRCQLGMEQALNFGDNQVMAHYGLVHPSLTDPTLTPHKPAGTSETQSARAGATAVSSGRAAAAGAAEGASTEEEETEEEGASDGQGAKDLVQKAGIKKAPSVEVLMSELDTMTAEGKEAGGGLQTVKGKVGGIQRVETTEDELRGERVVGAKRFELTKRDLNLRRAQAEGDSEVEDSKPESRRRSSGRAKPSNRVQEMDADSESDAQE